MGKVRQLRSRVHSAAVRFTAEAAPGPTPGLRAQPSAEPPRVGAAGKDLAAFGTKLFAGTNINLSTLVQQLDSTTRNLSAHQRDEEKKAPLNKKERMKLRRENWLHKIEAVKQAEKKRLEEQRRRATEVVGDLRPLLEALPTLAELESPSGQRQLKRPSRKPRPTELRQMSGNQRIQFLMEESARFKALLSNPAYRANPLEVIGQRLPHQLSMDGILAFQS
ncbi:ribosome biogenesis protein SLX9 homolog [Tenrec ecaudatus]|uniref:ribosome biogenesis protein SLX9 homolog n=1 Tax=Tenrec ecaudatus TaxID=94439 RepID=UPI003F5A78A2